VRTSPSREFFVKTKVPMLGRELNDYHRAVEIEYLSANHLWNVLLYWLRPPLLTGKVSCCEE